MSLENFGLKCRNLKCFGDEPQGFDEIKPINIIIGRNNSGKTTLLEMVEAVTQQNELTHLGHKDNIPEIYVVQRLTEELIVKHLSTEQARINTDNHGSYFYFIPQKWGRTYLKDKTALLQIRQDNLRHYGKIEVIDLDEKLFKQRDRILEWEFVRSKLGKQLNNPYEEYRFRRILADRDIVPEESENELKMEPNGRGLTNTIQRFVHARMPGRDRDLIEKTLLDNLNQILRPDAEYKRILPEELPGKEGWEISLDEPRKQKYIPISQTGSGFKTVLLVLSNLIILPVMEKKDNLEKYIFGFEELENNLHPAVQRRLFLYLKKKAITEKCHFFITTHSNVVIDLFSRDEHAQILHVRHDGESATVSKVKTTFEGHSVLTDLDVRASDLLQTNAVVWVEGPSDMIYFNKWIELWTNGKLIEGIHYQCLSYGGSLNKYLSFDDPAFVDDMIAAFRINRHAIYLADSDRKKAGDNLKPHTRRLKEELERNGGYAWITKGKEVENYIPKAIFPVILSDESAEGPREFSNVIDYLRDKSSRKTWNKPELAESVGKLLTKEMIAGWSDMKEQLESVCAKIREWNRVEEAVA